MVVLAISIHVKHMVMVTVMGFTWLWINSVDNQIRFYGLPNDQDGNSKAIMGLPKAVPKDNS